MKRETIFKQLYQASEKYGKDKDIIKSFLRAETLNRFLVDTTATPSKKKGHRATKRQLVLTPNPNTSLPITLHASLASTFDRHGKDKTVSEFLRWYEDVKKNYDSEMYEIYEKHKENSQKWVEELHRRQSPKK